MNPAVQSIHQWLSPKSGDHSEEFQELLLQRKFQFLAMLQSIVGGHHESDRTHLEQEFVKTAYRKEGV